MAPKAMKDMKAMKAMKAMKGTFANFQTKKVLKKAKAIQAKKKYPLTEIFVKSWSSCYEGPYRNWRLTELKNEAGIVTEVWTGTLK